jgi:hypothetical protein
MSTSSMQSAPAHIPAIKVASFEAGLADPEVIRGKPVRNFHRKCLSELVPINA